MDPEALIDGWLSSDDGALDPTLGWVQIDVSDLSNDPVDTLFDWSMELFLALVRHLEEIRSDDFALLAVPLAYSDAMDMEIPSDEEVASIGNLLQGPGLYRARRLLDAWQPVERFRIPVEIGLQNEPTVTGFYTCWRTMPERSRGEEYARDLQYIWRSSALQQT